MENKFLESLHKFFHQWCLTSVPNPANTVINIVSEVGSPFTVHLYNLVGKNMTEAKVSGGSIDISEISVGGVLKEVALFCHENVFLLKKETCLINLADSFLYLRLIYLATINEASMSKYGEYLKSLRNLKGLSLREVEKRTGISNAYLSQLEGSKVKQPSPIYLYKLATLYDVSYDDLMKKVGYPTTNAKDSTQDDSSSPLGKITEEEEDELIDYLKFIRKRKRK